ncbi:class I SAM-dependent methyltransferase [Paenibacillus flagellatus]|uniref:SAM-dependent methyltransferase n=1 Tax=Paenibacillus flagellatus TaxID=2211139 RepID=A0A2V5JW17_9BACL|nr:class I SAM-dependent methyltransferase [Paenibacillus flagellatus]PYI50352.1 SAM-dependent methyltransferase [Paenibacillus flagellatus]
MEKETFEEKESIVSREDVLRMLDSFLREEAPWWDRFYEDREKDVPFFVNAPDENMVRHFEEGRLRPGRALDLGCGPGRNALYLAGAGCEVDAVDLSQKGLDWARDRAAERKADIRFRHGNAFELDFPPHAYDIVYDSGCFHHVPPHRRETYLDLLDRVLKPGGHFGLTCFAGGIGYTSELSDWDVYRQNSLRGGLGFHDAKLRAIFNRFEVVEMRMMKPVEQPADRFGVSFLWTALFRRPAPPSP